MAEGIKKESIKKKADRQFVEEVFPTELEYVRSRRAAVESGDVEDKAEDSEQIAARPSVKHGLVGLAFSGGGIRSATINLGIAQQLHRRGVFDHVDYLSTVSGGGYTGSSISTLMREKGAEFPYEHTDGPTETPCLTWIRNHSNYLATNGFIDYMRIGALLLRGIALNFLVLVPGMLVISLILGLYYGGDKGGRLNHGVLTRWADGEPFQWTEPFNFSPWVLALAVIFYLAYPAVIRVFKVMTKEQSATTGSESSVKLRDFYERLHAWVMVIVGAVVVIEGVPILVYWFHRAGELGQQVAGIGAIGALIAVSGAVALVKLLGGLFKKLVILFIGLLGLLLPLLFILVVGEWLAYQPTPSVSVGWVQLVDGRETVGGAWYVLVALWALMTAGGLASLVAKQKWSNIVLVGIGGLIGAVVGIWILKVALASGLQPPVFVAAVAFVTWLFCWSSLDINLTSMHGFYRDRLASAYLVGIDTEGDVDIEQDIDLGDICKPGSTAPYHIVNVAHNLQGSKDPSIRERQSDFFFFSKNWVGGNHTGYCSSEHLEGIYPQMDLATAMAISAAAASPNMGKGTGASMVAIMTLLNARLGYWIPNPKRVNEWVAAKEESGKEVESGSLWNRFVWRIRPRALVKEFFSGLDETWDWVNLSDGGHLENLATYELLRRRCKYIIAGDGEADPAMTFEGLAELMRFARIDMGIEIEVLLDDLRLGRIDPQQPGPQNHSYQHCAFGKIHYPASNGVPAETGYLVYVKSSVTGDEDEVINQYHANHPEFPHESTADQFFTEGQFEAYRDLGYHMAGSLFEQPDAAKSRMDRSQFESWFDDLASDLAPRMAAESLFAELQSDLGSIRAELQEPEFEEYFYEIYSELKPDGWSAAEAADPARKARRLIYLVGEQLRLMENVFVELNFERPRNWKHEGNKGWKTLFETWAKAPSFRKAFKTSIAMHSPKFREFCEKRLDLT